MKSFFVGALAVHFVGYGTRDAVPATYRLRRGKIVAMNAASQIS